jgi:hypothetical protein
MHSRPQDDLYRAIRAALRTRRAWLGRRLEALVRERGFDDRIVLGLLRQHDEINAALRIVGRVKGQWTRRQRKGGR